MDQAQQMALLLNVFNQLFAANPQPIVTNAGTYYRQVFKTSGCRYFDFNIALAGGKKLALRMVEQNRNKEVTPGQLTYYAALARQGHMIAWLIDRNVPKGQNAYLGSVQDDGQWSPARQTAVQPTKPGQKAGYAITTPPVIRETIPAGNMTAVASQTVVREMDPQPEELDVDALVDVNDDIPEYILQNYPDPAEAMDDFDEWQQRVNQ